MGKIFISYRRADTEDVSGRMHDLLAKEFGDNNIFKDVYSIPLGRDFRAVLHEAVGACAAMLVVIGRQWLTVSDEQGRPRLENPADFVRIELEEALARDISVIPVLVQGAGMPRATDIPDSLASFAYRNGFAIRADPYFRPDMDMLIARLKESLASVDPSAPLLREAQALLRERKFAEALPLLERATQLDPDSSMAWAHLARTYCGLGRNSEAVTLAERALAKDSNLVIAWFAKGTALLNLQRYEEALVALDRAVGLDPTATDAWHNRGVTLSNLRRPKEALASYEQSLALDSTGADTWGGKGNALNDLKRYEEALIALDRALALDPTAAYIWRVKGIVLGNLDRQEEALVAYDRSLALESTVAVAWHNKGVALEKLHRSPEALVAYDRALALDPNDAFTWTGKGTALLDLKRPAEALVAYDRALALDSTTGLLWRNKAAALHALGRTAEARVAEQRAQRRWAGKGAFHSLAPRRHTILAAGLLLFLAPWERGGGEGRPPFLPPSRPTTFAPDAHPLWNASPVAPFSSRERSSRCGRAAGPRIMASTRPAAVRLLATGALSCAPTRGDA